MPMTRELVKRFVAAQGATQWLRRRTKFTVSIEAAVGVTTGISAADQPVPCKLLREER
jgi:3,4-dihydroxy-2-butanone 4-phosphate synthase